MSTAEKKKYTLKTALMRFFIAICILAAFSIYNFISHKKLRGKLEKEYFNNINFTFTGEVVGKLRYNSEFGGSGLELQPNAGPKFNIFYLETIKSTILDYDPRDTSVEFYCIVKQNNICIIESTERKNIEGGDIIKFDGIKDTTFHYKIVRKRKGDKIYSDTLLYAKWRPTDIFNVPNRPNLVEEVLRGRDPF